MRSPSAPQGPRWSAMPRPAVRSPIEWTHRSKSSATPPVSSCVGPLCWADCRGVGKTIHGRDRRIRLLPLGDIWGKWGEQFLSHKQSDPSHTVAKDSWLCPHGQIKGGRQLYKRGMPVSPILEVNANQPSQWPQCKGQPLSSHWPFIQRMSEIYTSHKIHLFYY